ncbi:hypothetical protein CISIN_1g009722mg [Citrus sinensis]|uniref:Hydroxyproline-rich glycoprotein family protein n=1 Tax=Citrus sinensis TaxID=2711 RepID=A0A067DS48_CITSI|nr:hypothetical protein CISIN_1g009722mg [Citrus sinensis]
MRGVIGRRISNPNNFIIPNVTNQTTFSFCSGSSGSGRGRGRGVPTGSSPFDRSAPAKPPGQPAAESKPESSAQRQPPSSGSGHGRGHGVPTGSSSFDRFTPSKAPGQPASESKPDSPPQPQAPPSGSGHGRGQPSAAPSPSISSFSSFLTAVKSGAGRGRVSFASDPNESPRPDAQPAKPRTCTPNESATDSTQPSEPNLPSSIISTLPGAGRGKTAVTQQQQQQQQHQRQQPGPPPQEENRHIRARLQPQPRPEKAPAAETGSAQPKLSKEDAVKMAMKILSRGEEGEGEGISAGGPGRGRGMGRGRGRGRGRGQGRGRMRRQEMEDDEDGRFGGLYLGDNADGEKLAEKVGAEKMNMLVEGFEEMSGRVLPSPMEDAYIDALHTNCMIEFEPEYLMEEFGTNPDIDEKPPIPLRDALEKMKPFLMAYEGIQSQEEWEEAVNEVMERVPLLKEIVDHYSGPDRVTAKQQGEELERVAKTIPESAPASIKRFANRAVLSLQSNPGWGFDKKCQFMDKLAWEVSQHYK